MRRIIYNMKLKKVSIATLIIILLFNFIFPNTISFVYAAVYNEKMFWPSHPTTDITSEYCGMRVAPEDLDKDLSESDRKEYTAEASLVNCTDWDYEDWKKEESTYQVVVGDSTNFTQNSDMTPAQQEFLDWFRNIITPEEQETDYDSTSVTAGVNAFNTSLQESYNWNQEHSDESEKIKLVDALNKAIDEAVAARK